MNTDAPIGVFDSGLGGLSVLSHLHARLPGEQFIYVSDAAHAPYGDRSEAHVRERTRMVSELLIDQGVKALVVACNTASAAALEVLRETYTLPIIGLEPAVKPAVACSTRGVVAVLSTRYASRSERLARLIERYALGCEVVVQACPGWVELVERGELDAPAARDLVERYVRPVLARGADTLVLGCTHYPFLSPLIRDVAGDRVRLLDSGAAVAAHTAQRLAALGGRRSGSPGGIRFLTSGDRAEFLRGLRRLWGPVAEIDCIDTLTQSCVL